MVDGPLSGFRVIDFTASMSGPFGTMILGDQGADVIKVEPPEGDIIREVGTARSGISAYFAGLNRNKRSVVLDLTSAEGLDLAHRLIDGADVVVQNFRPAVASRFGLTAPQLRPARPDLIVAAVLGFGPRGPGAGLPVYDHLIQAASGMAALQADPKSGEVRLIRQGIADKVTALGLAQAITAALLHRARTGEGCQIEIAMLDAAVAFLWPDGMMGHAIVEPEVTLPTIANTFRAIPTTDGYVTLVALTSQQWSSMLDAVGYPPDGDESATGSRARNGAVLKEVEARIAVMTTAEVLSLMAEYDVPCSAVIALEDVLTDPQLQANDTVLTVDHPFVGPLRQARSPARFAFQSGSFEAGRLTDRPTPALGEHSAEVLAELGLSHTEVAELAERGVTRLGPQPPSVP